MYFISAGLFAAGNDTYLAAATADPSVLTWGAFFVKNLLPVTIGNIIGGSLLTGVGYWLIYLRGSDKKVPATAGKK
jgi:formate/nitrite transporter FocA (FNT family)